MLLIALCVSGANELPPSDYADNSSSIVEILTANDKFDSTTALLTLDETPSVAPAFSHKAEEIIGYASNLLGRPYRRGGKTVKGFDCSGFTSHIFGQFGVRLSASSSTQYLQGESIDIADARPGDLIFFSGRRISTSRVGHVGMIVDVDAATGKVKFIHSATSGGVKYDTYPDDGYYANRYIGTRRVID